MMQAKTSLGSVITLTIILTASGPTFGQAPYTIEWQRCLGGGGAEGAYSIDRSTDGGLVVVGSTSSVDGDISTPPFGDSDIWVIKLDASGNIEWNRCFGGSSYEVGNAVKQTADGGFVVVGSTASNDGDVIGNHGSADIWVLKLNALGELVWQRCLGGSSQEDAWSIEQTIDEGYIIAGFTSSNNGDVSGNNGQRDAWFVKLDAIGNIDWQRCHGGPGQDSAWELSLTTDGGYIVAGGSNSTNIPILPGLYGVQNFWVLKLDADGALEWEHVRGGPGEDVARSVLETPDGGYLVAGHTKSLNGDVACNHGETDFWLLRLDANGEHVFDRCFGGSGGESAFELKRTTNGNYVLLGTTWSSDGIVQGHNGNVDGWLIEVDPDGELIWQLCLGGPSNDYLRGLEITPEGEILVVGSTNSASCFQPGQGNLWVVKLAPLTTGTPELESPPNLTLFPNPTTSTLHIQWSGTAPSTLEVLDMTGRLVYGPVVPGQVGEAGYALPVGALPAGLYAVRLQSATGSSVQRFVKE
jgi:hypothetical protein